MMLKEYREKASLSRQTVADYLGVSRQAYGNYENGNREPDIETLLKLAEYFGTTVDSLLRQSPEGTYPPSEIEINIIKRIRALDEHGRKMVDYVISEETRRIEEEKRRMRDEMLRYKIIPLFGASAAAGPGEPDTGNPFEDYEVPEDSKAEFAVRISGDSMEPYLRDQEIVLCTKRRPNVGEITVVMVNGCLLCKQYIPEGRNILLRSTNRERSDCDYTIFASSQDTVRCYGTVIHDRIPLADQ